MGAEKKFAHSPGRHILPTIVLSQFFCTSLWFAGNSILGDLAGDRSLSTSFLANLTGAIQLGFVVGTLVFAFLAIVDRFSPVKVFFVSSVLAALFNLGICLPDIDAAAILVFRFLTGFFLAGIYPVGMKIAADHYQAGLGKSLGFLVGALALGTASPHLLKTQLDGLPWQAVICATSFLALIGGAAMLALVPNGPFRQKAFALQPMAVVQAFRQANFRASALGYFGHMWELYTFWAFVPLILQAYHQAHPLAQLNVSFLSFGIIGVGGWGAALGGLVAQRFGNKRLAGLALLTSGLCCLLSPLFLDTESVYLFLGFLFLWGFTVLADSPLFSTLVAQHAPPSSKGSALTLVNCMGFAITIISLQTIQFLSEQVDAQYLFIFLAPGPALGLWGLYKRK